MTVASQRSSRGQMAYHAGSAAETSVARQYEARGCVIAETRWRGAGGEIDLIVAEGEAVIFVEVKKSTCFGAAALRISPRQRARIYASAEEYLGGLPRGSLTEARFDVALVDGKGAVQIIENAFGGE